MSVPFSKAYRARLLHFTDVPDSASGAGFDYFEDGVLLVDRQGCVVTADHAEILIAQGLDESACEHFPDQLLLPGLIDTHIHSSQTQVIASHGEQLLDWLNRYTFPAERAFADPEHAEREAERFLDLLLAHGTTTAMVYTSVHPASTEAFFQAAHQRRMRMIAGKVMMDRNAPPDLLDTPESSARQSRALIERWHQCDRLSYAVTPRFAPTSSAQQLELAGKIYRDYPGLYVQTHLSENQAELAWVSELFPEARDYLDVYDRYGLLGERSVFGHGLYLGDAELLRLAQTGSKVAFCPSSNLFLGSGLLDLERLKARGVDVSLATDVGGGTSFSMLSTLAEAYKVLQLQGQKLDPLQAFYWVTLGNARALSLDHRIGNFMPGKEADFILVDLAPTPLEAFRQSQVDDLSEALFALMLLGSERNIKRSYIMGEPVTVTAACQSVSRQDRKQKAEPDQSLGA